MDISLSDVSIYASKRSPPWRKPYDVLTKRRTQPPKCLVRGVSTKFRAGTLTAILGPSGSGKTSLLNAIGNRLDTGLFQATGNISFIGDHSTSRSGCGYLAQEESLLPSLTAYETLTYAADLRLPDGSSRDRESTVQRIISALALTKCAHTRIGDSSRKGCSGGERRRISLGIQLLTDPACLFCDEPTSSLDATSALRVVQILKALAERGRTIVLSIHAPRVEIWNLFDRVLLLSHGQVLFDGPRDDGLPYFEKRGYPSSGFANPADFLTHLASVERALERENTAPVPCVQGSCGEESRIEAQTPAENMDALLQTTSLYHRKAPFRRQLRSMISRTFHTSLRDPKRIFTRVLGACLLGVVTGWIFSGLGNGQSSVLSKESAYFTITASVGYVFMTTDLFFLPPDIRHFDYERSESVTTAALYMLSQRAGRLMVEDIPVPLIYACSFYFLASLNHGPAEFFTFLFILYCFYYVTLAISMICSALSRDLAISNMIAGLILTVQYFGMGFFITTDELPVYVRWIKWIGPIFYAFGGFIANEFVGWSGDSPRGIVGCPDATSSSDPGCMKDATNYIMENVNLPMDWLWRSVLALVVFVPGLQMLATLALHYSRPGVKIRQSSKFVEALEWSKEAGDHSLGQTVQEQRPAVEVCLRGLEMCLRRRNCLLAAATTDRIPILASVSATFSPHALNVILGPSGSGKTSLLHLLGGQTRSAFPDGHDIQGQLLYNGARLSDRNRRSICAQVSQDGNDLVPSLTVREALVFSAGLRLPPSIPTKERMKRVADLLSMVGLDECADVLIGDQETRGISGGQRRRVSIALRLLTNSSVLILDEPTSGLDTNSATAIIHLLERLAAEGRTVIASIHQAPPNVWPLFSNILVMADDGRQIYAGPAGSVLPYLEDRGFHCPEGTNPADFILDCVSSGGGELFRLMESDLPCETSLDKLEDPPALDLAQFKREPHSFWSTFSLVIRRSWVNLLRRPDLVVARLAHAPALGIVMILCFPQLGTTEVLLRERTGAVFQVLTSYIVGNLQSMAYYPGESDIFRPDFADDSCSVTVFLLQYTCIELAGEIISSLVFSAIIVFGIGLRRNLTMFLVTWFNACCLLSCGESMGMALFNLSSNLAACISLMTVAAQMSWSICGLINPNLPPVLAALSYLAPTKYSGATMLWYSLSGRELTCDEGANCAVADAQGILRLYHADDIVPWHYLVALGACTVIHRLVVYLILVLRKRYGNLSV